MAPIAGAEFESVLPVAPNQNRVRLKPFRMDKTPVTNGEFAAFVRANPQWRRDRVGKLFADGEYLSHWTSASAPDAKQAKQPVTRVSWYAARAYCEARGARLPTWYEWEWAAAASDRQKDARKDPAWKQQILAWYSRPAGDELPNVGALEPNVYGIHDLHGLVWEWIEDYNGMLVSGDNRQQSEPDATRFCGPGALTMEQKEHYAILMRIAMLSAMQANYTTETMGFRCVQ
jgi:formylglycine-generating enzyme required for sulfatase activity